MVHALAYLPTELAKLSKFDKKTALDTLREWGESTASPVDLFKKVTGKEISIATLEKDDVKNDTSVTEGKSAAVAELQKRGFQAMSDLVRIRQLLPSKLAELSYYDQNAALSLIQDWGEGNKPLRELWSAVHDELKRHE